MIKDPIPFRCKPLPILLSTCLLMTACNNNDDDKQTSATQLLEQPNLVANEVNVAVNSKTIAPLFAKLGPLQGASVLLFDPIDKGNALATGTTGADGRFILNFATQNIPLYRPLVLMVEGGMDTDPDDDATTSNTPIVNKGRLHAIVFANDLFNSQQNVIVSPVTELVYQRLNNMFGTLAPDVMREKLDQTSSQLLNEDITGNKITNYNDILAFDPSDKSMHDKLLVNFSKYHQKLSNGKSYIEALRDNDQRNIQMSFELLGSNAPDIALPETNTADNIKLDIAVNGYGSLESPLFKTGKWRNSDGIYTVPVPRNLQEKYAVKVSPDAGRKIVSWVGCSSISSDKTTCLIKPDQSKTVSVTLENQAEFQPSVTSYQEIPFNSDVVISDSAGVMTISTRNQAIAKNLVKLPVGAVMSLPYLPHPLIGVTEIVSTVSNTEGAEIKFKFVDKHVTDVLKKATFYSNSTVKPNIGLEDVVSVTMINDKNLLRDPKVNTLDSRFDSSPLRGNSQTQVVPQYKDKSGGNHLVSKSWELVIHKDKCVIYADDTQPTTHPTIPSDPKNDTVWTSALRAAEGECDNKTLIYKKYKDYALDFQLTGVARQDLTNTNHARFANMRYMQHMDVKTLANTPLYLISGNKKQGEQVRTAAAWTWVKDIGPILKVRKNIFVARREDGRAGFDIISFDDKYRPKGNLYNVSDFKCPQVRQCNLKEARLPNMPTYGGSINNPWYFGPQDPIPSPYKHAVEANTNLLGSDGLSMDFPIFGKDWIKAGVNVKIKVGMATDYLFDFDLGELRAAFKLIPEIALEPRFEVNLKLAANKDFSASKASGQALAKAAAELTLFKMNLGYQVIGPVASVIKPELAFVAGVEVGGEAKIFAAYTRGMKAKFGIDAFYDKDFHWDWWDSYFTTQSRLDFPRGFETYKSEFEFGVEGQLYVEPYLEARLQGSITGVADEVAKLGVRGFINANAGFEAGVALKEVNKGADEVNQDIDKILAEYQLGVLQKQIFNHLFASKSCFNANPYYNNCASEAREESRSFDSVEKAKAALKQYNLPEEAPTHVKDAQRDIIMSVYQKSHGEKFVGKVLAGKYTKSERVNCKVGFKIGLDVGIRATAEFDPQKIKVIGGWLGMGKQEHTLFEHRVPVGDLIPSVKKFIDKVNEKGTICKAPDEPEAEEEDGKIEWKTNLANGNQYALIKCHHWQDCKTAAAKENASLVSITSEQENDWVKENFVEKSAVWIGFNDLDQEGSFKWTTNEAVSYTNWNSGEPNNVNNEDAASMLPSGKWNDNYDRDTAIKQAVIEMSKDVPQWTAYNGREYLISQCGRWHQCNEQANSLGVSLVSIDSVQLNNWLVDHLKQFNADTKNEIGAFWIGLNDVDQENNFKWTSGANVSYTNWNSGEPNNVGNEDATTIGLNGRWNDDNVNNGSVKYAIFQRPEPLAWKVNSANNHSYAILECGSWPECQQAAQNAGANLVTINDQAEQEWLYGNFPSTTKYWIGLTDKDQEGNWQWISGENSSYTNWNWGEPNNVGDEDYAEIVENGRWNDAMLTNRTVNKGVIEKNN